MSSHVQSAAVAPVSSCRRCGRTFAAASFWGGGQRRSFCSTFCAARPLEEVDHALERALMFLLEMAPPGASVTLRAAAGHVGGDHWSELLPLALEAARRLAAAGDVVLERDAGGQRHGAVVRMVSPPEPRGRRASGIRPSAASRRQAATAMEPHRRR